MTDTLKEIVGDVSVGVETEVCDKDSGTSLEPLDINECIPTGIDLLNLNVSGTALGGFRKGSVVELSAENGVGKTLFAMNLMKTCILDDRFDGWKFRYIDKENGANFDLPAKVKERIEIYDASNMGSSLSTIERTYLTILNWLDEGVPQIIALDSMNAFIAEAQKSATEENQKIVGGDKSKDLVEARIAANAAASSRFLPLISEKLNKTGSLLILVSQFRDSMESKGLYASYMDKQRTSGGRSVHYFCDYRVLFLRGSAVKKTVETGRELVQAYSITIKTLKNRGNGVECNFSVPFRGSALQIGNIQSMFNYLHETGNIKGKGAYFSAEWMNEGKNMLKKDFQLAVRDNPEYLAKMREACRDVWVMEQMSLNEGIF